MNTASPLDLNQEALLQSIADAENPLRQIKLLFGADDVLEAAERILERAGGAFVHTSARKE